MLGLMIKNRNHRLAAALVQAQAEHRLRTRQLPGPRDRSLGLEQAARAAATHRVVRHPAMGKVNKTQQWLSQRGSYWVRSCGG